MTVRADINRQDPKRESAPKGGRHSAEQGGLPGNSKGRTAIDNMITEREVLMANNSFMRVEDVSRELGVSTSYAYKIIRKLNAELEKKGIITITGRVNRKYFAERLCYGAADSAAAERR